MAKVTTNDTSISYVVEVTPGETPATPTFETLPTLDGSPMLDITTAVSESICAGRQVTDLIPVDGDVTGEINYEVSYDPYKPLFIQLMRDTVVTYNSPAATVTFSNAGTITAAGESFVTDGLLVGMHVRVSGADPTNDGLYEITALTETILTVSPSPATDETDVTVALSTTAIRNGTDDPITNTFLKTVRTDPINYFYYLGTVISQMTLNFELGAILRGSLSVVGRSEDATTTGIPGQTIGECPLAPIMNSVYSIAKIEIGGLPEDTCFQSLNLTFNNNSTGAKCIKTFGNADVQDFTFDVTGSIVTYFEDLVLYNKFKTSESFSVYIELIDTDENMIAVTLPRCKFEELAVPIPGRNEFLTMPGTIRALRSDDGYTAQFEFYDGP